MRFSGDFEKCGKFHEDRYVVKVPDGDAIRCDVSNGGTNFNDHRSRHGGDMVTYMVWSPWVTSVMCA